MGFLYRRGDSQYWWASYKNAHGRRRLKSTGLTDEAQAQKALEILEQGVRIQRETGAVEDGPLVVARYFESWIAKRKERGIASVKDDATRVRLHALPKIGRMALGEVRPMDMLDLVRAIEAKGLAPRTVGHVYGVLHVMYAEAAMRGLVNGSPCVLSVKRGELPKKRDKNPRWRAGAVYTRAEVESLISDSRIPERRRVLYALEFLGGMRANEVTPRRWRDYDATQEPLGRLTVATGYDLKGKKEKETTKTGVTREVPVHPVLAKMLARWRLSGWAAVYGRPPADADLIVPGANGAEVFASSTSNLKRLHEDLTRLGLRIRRQHDTRRTFISLCLADGGRKDVLRWITHAPADQMDAYTTLPWEALCGEVSKLRISLREGQLTALSVATAMLRKG